MTPRDPGGARPATTRHSRAPDASPGSDESPLRTRARTTAWGLAWYAATCFAGGFFAEHAMAASGVQAAIAEWGSSRLGVAWTDPDAPEGVRAVATRAARGFGAGLVASAALVVIAVASGAATLARGRLAVASVIVALLDAAFVAVRDELLLHGLVLRVVGERARGAALAACGLASAAAALGAAPDGMTAPALVATALGGVALGALWIGDRGAWMPVCAHAAWLWATSSLARGALVDVRVARSAPTWWSGGSAGLEAGGAAVIASLAAAVAAAFWLALVLARASRPAVRATPPA